MERWCAWKPNSTPLLWPCKDSESEPILFFTQYIANHAQEAEAMKSMPLPDSPRLMMAMVGPVIGLISGIVIGVFAVLAGRFFVKAKGLRTAAHV